MKAALDIISKLNYIMNSKQKRQYFIVTFLALIGQRLFPMLHSDLIIIGDIMLLIPGLAFCNSIHDMVMGDTISGVLSMFDAVLRALSIAIGYVAVWAVMGRLL